MRMSLSPILAVVVMLGTACATTPASPPSVNVTGKWAGDWSFENPSLGAGTLSGAFQQDGSKLSGNFSIVGGGGAVRYPSASVVGTVSGSEIWLSQPSSGTLTVKGNEISGMINGLDAARVTLRKQP